ncbi:hypothetical protein [Bradyrhizobium sp. JYMT SZCCT0180]|uniref:hypothetical protein n=1 Tax=Bradyrhizobium sp. JYMT SZCCT0180 TaxID=2807666 RepID=UPI001BA81B28|nr:hypothetical protein [Bradyrhizobium sp. JYMT SZCCT0180]MBR1214326.1 hypothetical protein [Bradyrhizobium sp. JYMT SZCCT0180]
MRSLSLTVVAARHCPTSRTYLTYLKEAGFRPSKVLLVDFVGYVPRYASLRKKFGERLAWLWLQRLRSPAVTGDDEFWALCRRVQANVPRPIDYSVEFDHSAYCDKLQRVTAVDYNDAGLHRTLRRQSCKIFLYTDGGRVPPALLNDPSIRFLHIHPGVVPEVRGSDGLFWSLLIRGRPGASCFFMNQGIDTGDVIMTRDFDRPAFDGIRSAVERDAPTAYRAVLHAFDPHLRAQLFVDVVKHVDGDLRRLTGRRQEPTEGMSYYWMHPAMWRRVLTQLDTAPSQSCTQAS